MNLGRSGLPARLWAAALLSALALSCRAPGTADTAGFPGSLSSARRKTAATVDEAFAAILPEAAALLAKLPDGLSRPTGSPDVKKQTNDNPSLALSNMDAVIDEALRHWSAAAAEAPTALIASPLVAAKIAERRGLADAASPPATAPRENSGAEGAWPLPALVVLFARGFGLDRPEIYSIEYDFQSAYAAMGRKAAGYLQKAARKSGDQAYCGIVFQENFMRGKEALDAFAATFDAEIGEGRLKIKLLDSAALSVDPAGALRAAIESMPGKGAEAEPAHAAAAVLVLAVDDAFGAEAAAAEGGEIIFLADRSSWGKEQTAPGLFRYWIEADEAGLARAAIEAAKDIAGGRGAEAITLVPLRRGSAFPRIF